MSHRSSACTVKGEMGVAGFLVHFFKGRRGKVADVALHDDTSVAGRYIREQSLTHDTKAELFNACYSQKGPVS